MNRVAKVARVRRELRDWLQSTNRWTIQDWQNTYLSAQEVGLGTSLKVELEQENLWGVRLISVLQVAYAKFRDDNEPLRDFDIAALAVLKELGHDIYKLPSRADFYYARTKQTKMLGHERVIPIQEAINRLDERYKYQYTIRNLAGLNYMRLGKDYKFFKELSREVSGTVKEFRVYEYKADS